MNPTIPSHAERIELGGETAWIWEISYDKQIGERRIQASGWKIAQGHGQINLENSNRHLQDWHMIDWLNYCPRGGDFSGGLSKNEAGHLGRAEFIEIVAALRRQDAPPAPPERQQPA